MTRTSKLRRIGSILLFTALAVGGVVALLWFFVLPGALRSRLASTLEDMGFSRVVVEDVEISTDSIRIAKLAFGSDARLEVRELELRYALASVLAARFEVLRVAELTLALSPATGGIDGLLPAKNSSAGPPTALLPDLRVARIEIDSLALRDPRGVLPPVVARADCQVLAEAAGLTLSSKGVLGAADSASAGAASSRFAARAFRLDLALQSAGLDATGEISLTLHDSADPAETAESTASDLAGPLKLEGRLGLTRSAASWSGSVDVSGGGLVDIELGRARLRGRLRDFATKGSFDSAAERAFEGRFAMRLPREGALELSGDVPPALSGLRVSGEVRGEAAASLTIGIKDVDFELPKREPGREQSGASRLAVRSLAGSMDLPRGASPSRRGAHELRWQSVRAGERFDFGPGSALLRVERDPFCVVLDAVRQSADPANWDRARRAWFTIGETRITPAASEVEIALSLQRIDVQRILERLGEKRVEAQAVVSGTLPLRLRYKPSLHVRLRAGGTLRALGPGTLRFAQDEGTTAILDPYVEQIASAVAPGHESEVRERILGSMRDFAYERLSMRVLETGGRSTLALRVQGKGRKVPQEMDVTLNVHGVQDLLDLAFELQEAVEKTRERVESKLDNPRATTPGSEDGRK